MKPIVILLLAACCTIGDADREVTLTRASLSAVVVEAGHSYGSGSVIDKFHVLTCNHVIVDETEIRVIANLNGVSFIVPATVEKSDPRVDLALLRTAEPMDRPPIVIAPRKPHAFAKITIIGFPRGAERLVSDMMLAGWSKEYGWAMTGGSVMSGVSGGMGVDAQGRLVCVPWAMGKLGEAQYPGLGFCIPLASVKAFLK